MDPRLLISQIWRLLLFFFDALSAVMRYLHIAYYRCDYIVQHRKKNFFFCYIFVVTLCAYSSKENRVDAVFRTPLPELNQNENTSSRSLRRRCRR